MLIETRPNDIGSQSINQRTKHSREAAETKSETKREKGEAKRSERMRGLVWPAASTHTQRQLSEENDEESRESRSR
ncbi:hypothetical protein BKA81DRAFT_359822 [Phyllosticta paracitricarpa]